MGFWFFVLAFAVYVSYRRIAALKNDFEEKIEQLELNNQILENRQRKLEKELKDIRNSEDTTKIASSESDNSYKESQKDTHTSKSEPLKESEPQVIKDPVVSETKAKSKIKVAPSNTELPPELPVEVSFKSLDEKDESSPESHDASKNEYSWRKTPKNEARSKQPTDKFANNKETEEIFIDEKPANVGDFPPPTPPLPPSPPEEPSWGDKFREFSENVDWEQFTGTKLFAWLGGIALFIGAGFFVKYSIDKNLISPILRLVIGALVGLGMVGASGWFERVRYDIMRQTFAAGGIGVLYSVFFAATLYYEYLPKPAGFACLVVVSAAAFVLSVFHQGVSISVLGAIGAYLTPLLVNTGSGSLVTMFIYLAIVNIGLYQVIKRLLSSPLLLFGSVGTMISLFAATCYSNPDPVAGQIAIAWSSNLILFSIFIDRLKFQPSTSRSAAWTASSLFLMLPLMALFVTFNYSGSQPLLMLTVAVVCAAVIAIRNVPYQGSLLSFSAITFAVAVVWTLLRFNGNIDNWSFLLYFIYGLAAGIGPLFVIKRHGINEHYLKWFKVFPVAMGILGLIAIIANPQASFLFWPMTMGIQIVGIILSLLFGAIFQVGILAIIMLLCGLTWINSATAFVFGPVFYGFVLLSGAAICMAVFYFLKKGADIAQSLGIPEEKNSLSITDNMTQWMAAAPVSGIFLLIAATFLKASPLNPHPGMLTIACFATIALVLTKKLGYQNMGVVTIFSAVFSQAFWMLKAGLPQSLHFYALGWATAFFVLALVVPFAFFSDLKKWRKLWMGFAIFEGFQAIYLIFAADHIWPREISGWLPLILVLIKMPIVSKLLKKLDGAEERNSIIACHGGVLLFYASSVPLLLLEKGWLGLVLVLEGTALLWLNRRIEHPGLRWVSLFMSPIGLFYLVSFMNQMKGPESVILLNPAVISMALAVVALALAAKLAPFPEEKLGTVNILKVFQWLAVGAGFYFVNLIVADVFAGSKVQAANSLNFLPRGNLLQYIAYTSLWALFGAALWRTERAPVLMRWLGVVLVFIASAWLLMFPFLHGYEVAKMGPIINIGLLAYLPIMGILLFLFLKEPWQEKYFTLKNVFLALLLLCGLLCIKLVKSTLFQAGMPLELFREKTANMAVASIFGWIIYGLAMILWPKRLDKPFRLGGLILVMLAFMRAVLFPFKFSAEFGAMSPILNKPTALFLVCIGVLIWMTRRKEDKTWPLDSFKQKSFWALILSLMTFAVMNIEIASVFGQKGQSFSLLTHGNLSHQLGYSLGWLVYAIVMLASGIRWKVVRARQAALILIIVTSFKIFFKDLWSLGQLYRVASFVGLAVVLMLVSYLYQRFLTKTGEN